MKTILRMPDGTDAVLDQDAGEWTAPEGWLGLIKGIASIPGNEVQWYLADPWADQVNAVCQATRATIISRPPPDEEDKRDELGRPLIH